MAKIRGAAQITVISPNLHKLVLQNLITNFQNYTTSGYSLTVANCTRNTTNQIITTTTSNGFQTLVVGMGVNGTGISIDTFIQSINSPNSITLTKPPTSNGTGGLTFFSTSIDIIKASDQFNEATLNIAELYEDHLTQESLSPISKTITGSRCALSISIADDRLSLLKLSSNGVVYGNQQVVVLHGNPGSVLGDYDFSFKTVIIQPIINGFPSNDPLTWYIMPYAGIQSDFNLNFSLQSQRFYNLNFIGYDPYGDGYKILKGDPAYLNVISSIIFPPVANNDTYSTNRNITLNVNAATGILSNDTDANGDVLTAVLVTNVTNGVLTLNSNGSFVYVPNTNFSGTDSFTYRASDGQATSNIATVTIIVVNTNVAPVANNDTYSTNKNITLNVSAATGVLANDTDANGDVLSAILVTNVTNGVLTLNSNGSFVYIPNTNFFGSDSFTYRASDGQATSNVATVTITVNNVVIAPTANNNSYTTVQNVTLTVPISTGVLANDTDPNGYVLTTVLVTNVTNGTLTLNSNGSFTYVPNTNFSGTDTFTYRANNGQLTSNIATVTITVTPLASTTVTYLWIGGLDGIANENDIEYLWIGGVIP